ncbi:MAG TPA: hypothetical protein VNL91_09665, partial [Thermoanaerobaculia bacterium]|nr:hypothetical protein [Thermoanaerobaculia bacterium]
MRKALTVLLFTAVASTAAAAQRVADFRFGGRGTLADLAPREGGFLALVEDDGLRLIPIDGFGVAQEGRSARLDAGSARIASRGGRPMLLWSSRGDTYLSEVTIGTTTEIATSILLGTGGTTARHLACGPSRCAAVLLTPNGERIVIADDTRILRGIASAGATSAVASDPAGFLVIDTSGDVVRLDLDGQEQVRARVNARGSHHALFFGTDYVVAYERDGSILIARLADIGRSDGEVRIASGGPATPFAMATDGSQILFVHGPGSAATGPPQVRAIRLDANLRQTGNEIRLSGTTGANRLPLAAWSEGAFLTAWSHADSIGGIERSAPQFARVSPGGTVLREGIVAT